MNDARGIDLADFESRILDIHDVPPASIWCAAYSGGIDSTVLLHLLARICRNHGIRLVALHADHGISEHSEEWRRHCEQSCREWDVELRTTRLTLTLNNKLGVEGAAREARYRWFSREVGDGGWLFTAHHGDDQAETLIERLTRASGARGLRGIPARSNLYGINVVRPFLNLTRADIHSYAREHGINWVSDDTNDDSRYTRNYIRKRVMPVLQERWPGIAASLAGTAAVMEDANAILEQIAVADLVELDDRPIRGDPSVSIAALKALSPERQRNALRYWLHRRSGVHPGRERLNRIVSAAAGETFGGLCWAHSELRAYQGRLYLVKDRPAPEPALSWQLPEDLKLGNDIVLRARRREGMGLKETAVRCGVTVVFRRGGERCRLPGRRHHHALKKVLQDAGIPPWQRSRIPLITIDDEIAAIGDLICCASFAAAPSDPGFEIQVAYL